MIKRILKCHFLWLALSLGFFASLCGGAEVNSDARGRVCEFQAEVRGDAHHFLLYGRDAWEGIGSIHCQKIESASPLQIFHKVRVRYESFTAGIGADYNSILEFHMAVTEPHLIERLFGTFRTVGGAASSDNPESPSILIFQNSQTELRLSVKERTSRSPQREAFLRFGQISIRPFAPNGD